MARDPRYDVLFEPVRIGPVTAPNRFYQVPHCTGMGSNLPHTLATMRGIKAEGGWGVVCTENCSIHPSGEVSPYPEHKLWDDDDIPTMAMIAEAIHAYGALAGVELTHGGPHDANRFSRELPLAPSHQALVRNIDPVQARAMDLGDIRAYRGWQVAAAKRARAAGFDIVYVYAAHDYALPQHFLSRRLNQRHDEYGGSLENRARFLRELIEATKDAVGDACAVAVRFAVDEGEGPEGLTAEGEGRDVVELLAALPDLWDVNISSWENDSSSSRFTKEANQEPYVRFVKSVTDKPVVGVGRFTSPDTMVRQVKDGILDLIGAARPSIADPFLPSKIEAGRIDDIRECIGCNVCVLGDTLCTPLRCTQNPTMGEEWRRGWHPERIPAAQSDDAVLIVGAGPAGLECAEALGRRGYRVMLAEAGREVGGRVSRESRLPGLAEWARVRDHRIQRINQAGNVQLFLDSRLEAAHVLEAGAAHVAIAAGARWRSDGIGHRNLASIPGGTLAGVYTPDDVMDDIEIAGPVVILDDDHYYMGGVLAEKLAAGGASVSLVTPAAEASTWTSRTLEGGFVQKRLREVGIHILPFSNVVGFDGEAAEVACIHTDRRTHLPCRSLVLVTARLPNDGLYHELIGDPATLEYAGIKSVTRIGDCLAPGLIAAAVYSGHRYAREFEDEGKIEGVGFRRERIALS